MHILVLSGGILIYMCFPLFFSYNCSFLQQDTFLGEILGAVILASDQHLNPVYQVKPVKVLATGNLSEDGQIVVDEKHGKFVKILETLNEQRYYGEFAKILGEKMQSAVIGSFREQKKIWGTRPAYKSYVSESSEDMEV